MTKAKTLTWNDRLALIDYYKPNDEVACETFGVTQDELDTVKAMRDSGTFVPTANLDYKSYSNMFVSNNATSTTQVSDKSASNTSTSKPTTDNIQPPQSATKKIKVPQKRGRKGSKIQKAFIAIPTTPTEAEPFAANNNVSIAVLRQSKRFDKNPELGNVKVKKDKKTGQLMIWREKESMETI